MFEMTRERVKFFVLSEELVLQFRSSFHHLSVTTKKWLDTCILCVLRDVESTWAAQESQRERSAWWGLVVSFLVSLSWFIFLFFLLPVAANKIKEVNQSHQIIHSLRYFTVSALFWRNVPNIAYLIIIKMI